MSGAAMRHTVVVRVVVRVLAMALSTGLLHGAAAAEPAPVVRPMLGKRVPDARLAAQRGGADVPKDTLLNGSVGANQAVNVTTGGNTIGGGAFAGAGGVPVVVQNSGNNVLIQSSVVVNVLLK